MPKSIGTLGNDKLSGLYPFARMDINHKGVNNIEESSNVGAFAAIKNDGSVVAWGVSSPSDSLGGGDISEVKEKLAKGCVEIFATRAAFAALKSDGSVVTWGDSLYGGNSNSVADKLQSGVVRIFSSSESFAALKSDGSVVTWGDSQYGHFKLSNELSVQLGSGVKEVFSSSGGFAALKGDGSVVCWGREAGFIGIDSSLAEKLKSGVSTIFSTSELNDPSSSAFAALKDDGSVVTWGSYFSGGDSSAVAQQLKSGVVEVFGGADGFAAMKADGSIVIWGGSIPNEMTYSKLQKDVVSIVLGGQVNAALKKDGSVVSWGWYDAANVADKLTRDVVKIYSAESACAALKKDGSVIVWGRNDEGADASAVNEHLKGGVVDLTASGRAFAALKNDGSVVTWGVKWGGGDSSAVAEKLQSGVVAIYSTPWAFAALKNDGSVVTWGSDRLGGDSSSVRDLLSSGVVAFANRLTSDRFLSTPLTLEGGLGNDAYIIGRDDDVVMERHAQGIDTVYSGFSRFLEENVENIILSGTSKLYAIGNDIHNSITGNDSANSLCGGNGTDTIFGLNGNDTLDGGNGSDMLHGGMGDDVYLIDNFLDLPSEKNNEGVDLVQSFISNTLAGNFENLMLLGEFPINGAGNFLNNQMTGNIAANRLDGAAGNDILDGGGGSDTLIGGTGTDSLVGGAGNDIFIADDNADRVVEFAGGGHDFVQSTASNFTLPAYVEDLQLLGNAAISGRGNSLANILTGNAAANTLNGLSGNDTLLGGGGNDTLGVGVGLATVAGGVGSDLLQIDWSSITGGMLARSIQKIGTGADVSYKGSYAAKDITGKVLTQVNFESIEKLSLNGVLINLAEASAPGVVANRLSTTAKTSETGDKVDYSVALNVAPKGNVTLRFQSSDLTEGKVLNPDITFTPTNWNRPQKLTVQGVDDFDNDGNIGYTISGKVVTTDLTYNRISVPFFNLTNQEDTVDDPLTFDGTKAVDYFQGNNGNDRIYGDNGQDQLKGGRGNDRIYGENDNDRIFGELGNDELYGGYDDDTLDGGDGADSLFGEQGRDTLLGGAGNDYLDGGLLNDSMSGGAGNDTYLVDNAGDIINDLGATTDVDTVLVIQTISYTLPANVENASITASGNANLTGNALNNGLAGNDGKNILDGGSGNDKLDGGAGADRLLGGIGNDALLGGPGNDTFVGGAGVDLADFAAAGLDVNIDLAAGTARGDGTDLILDIENILTGEGNDTLTGSTGANDIDGGSGADSINGGAGNDTLAGCFYGKEGGQYEIDTLVGGAGNDIFQLGWASGRFYDDGNTKNAGRSDYVLITDFTVGQDRLQLDGASSNYYLAASGVSGVTGTGLWAEQGATDELIAIIRSANTTALNAANTINTAAFV